MSFRADLTAYLLLRSGLTTLIGNRLTPQKRDEGATLPAVTYSKVSGSKDSGLSGSVGHCTSEMQFDVWATGELQGESVVEALRDAMDGFHGTMGGTFVDYVEWGDDSEFLVDESGIAADWDIYHFVCSVTFYHSETKPTFA